MMEIDVVQLDTHVTLVRLGGRLDTVGVDKMETRFTAAVVAPHRNVIIDLAAVSFLASMGIRMLISSARALKLAGASMVLFGANEMVGEVLENAAIDQLIPVVADQEAALAAR
jgi:anti-anti-sigma factor